MEVLYINILVLIVIASITLTNGITLPLMDKYESEQTFIELSEDDTSNIRHKRSPDSLPERTDLTLTIHGEPVRLRLKRNININVNIPIYMRKDGHIHQVDVEEIQGAGLYQDMETGASLLLQREAGSADNHTQVFGSFFTNGHHYAVQPNICDTPSCLHRSSHVVSKLPPQTLVFHEPKIPAVTHVLKHGHQNTHQRHRRQTMNYKIEVLFVIDYKLYQFWYNLAPPTNRKNQALAMIRQYYAYTLNGMDLRYKSISGMGFILDVLSAGMFISDLLSDSPYTSDFNFNNAVDGEDTLERFQNWVNDQTGLPDYDHAMAFTGYNVAALTSGTVTGEMAGIAFTGTICTTGAMSLVEDDFNFIGITTAAHELGHSLDAKHDGSGNLCSSDDNFIMAVLNSVSPRSVGANLWRFSSCSLSAFKAKIEQLKNTNNNCLASESSSSTGPSVSVSMAEVYSPDETCNRVQGEGSYVCRGIQNYTAICISMYCKDPGSSLCYTVLAAEGTPCGYKKWCDMGFCVSSPEAPEVPDDCPLGDRPGIIESGLTCPELIQQSPEACYRLDKTCCESCKSIATGRTGCEYGDKGPSFCGNLNSYDCYSGDIEGYCCGTCSSQKNDAHVGCEFGDRFTGCRSDDCPFYSATDRDYGCCRTCYDGPPLTPSPTPDTTKAPTTTTRTTPKPTTTTTTTTTQTPPTTKTPPTTNTTPTSRTPIVTTPSVRTTRRTDTPTDRTTATPQDTTTAPPEPESESSNLPIIIGIGVGAGVIALVVIIVIIFCARRRSGQPEEAPPYFDKPPPMAGSFENTGFEYTENYPDAPRRPPPRRIYDGGYAPNVMANTAMVMPTSRLLSAPPKPSSNDATNNKPQPVSVVPPTVPPTQPNHPPPRRAEPSIQPQPIRVPMRLPGNASRNANGVAIISNGSSEYADGYMMPSTPSTLSLSSQQNIAILYTAPNKPSSRDSTSPNTNIQKRNNKPIHYRRPHDINRISSEQTNSGEFGLERKLSDTYDSIGDVMAKLEVLRGIKGAELRSLERRPTLPANRPTKRISEISKSSDRESKSELATVTPVVPRKCYRDSVASSIDTADLRRPQTPEAMVRPKPRPRERKLSNINHQSADISLHLNNNHTSPNTCNEDRRSTTSFLCPKNRQRNSEHSIQAGELIALNNTRKDKSCFDSMDLDTYDQADTAKRESEGSNYQSMDITQTNLMHNNKLTNRKMTPYSSINEIEICI